MNGLIHIALFFFLLASTTVSADVENKTIPLKNPTQRTYQLKPAPGKHPSSCFDKMGKTNSGHLLCSHFPDTDTPGHDSLADNEKWETASDAGLYEGVAFLAVFSDSIHRRLPPGRWQESHQRYTLPPPEHP